jgi:pyruvate formate lyase activating enzyme
MISRIECQLCPRHCRLAEGERGNCRVRINLDGRMKTLAYGNPCAVHIDPIEKKPLFHFLPGTPSFSIATAGCNLHCKYCQNWQISQRQPEETTNEDLPPEQVVSNALKSNCQSISYTYSDPIIFYEYTLDTAKLAKKAGIRNVLVTAGYIEQAPLLEWCPYIDAANVDLKGITDEFYQKMSSATLAPVQNTIVTMIKNGVWVEITNLIVPSWNDRDEDLRPLCRWVRETLGPDIPLHFSRFYPMHQLKNLPATPEQTLIRARDIALSTGLHYVYIGNVPWVEGETTLCPKDKNVLIRRMGLSVLENNIVNGKCKSCGTPIPGVWM